MNTKLMRLTRQLRTLKSAPMKAILRRAITLGPDLLRGKGISSALVNITLELTYRCNIKCEFCFLKDSVLNEKRDELTLQEIEQLADQAKDLGACFFLTGGEPFLRRDIVQIVAAIKKRGLKVGINTNGILVTEEIGKKVRDAGLDYIIFSLHGPREIHDCLEHRKGAFDKVIANLSSFARDKGKTRVIVNCVVAEQNAQYLSEVPKLLADIPVDGLTFQHETFLTANEVIKHQQVWEVLFPNRELPMVYQSSGYNHRDLDLLADQLEQIESRSDQGQNAFPVFFKPDLRKAALSTWYASDMEVKGRCLYIWTDIRVEPDGTVNGCQVMPAPMGNVRTESLKQILNSEAFTEFRVKNAEAGGVFPACARCCKLYRNPMNIAAREPTWKEWVDQADILQPVPRRTTPAPLEVHADSNRAQDTHVSLPSESS